MDDGDEDGDAEGESDDEDVGGRAGSQALGGRLSGVNQKLLSHVNGDGTSRLPVASGRW